MDHENRVVLNFEDKSVASYKSSVLNQIYHFKESHVKVTPEWLKQKNDSADFLTIRKEGGLRDSLGPSLHLLNGRIPNSEREFKS